MKSARVFALIRTKAVALRGLAHDLHRGDEARAKKSVSCPRSSMGFTLIELLVVIAIIALLSSVVLAALSSARSKARDAKRIADMRSVATALELYKDAHGKYPDPSTYGEYESGNPPDAGCWGWDTSVVQKNAAASSSWLTPLVTEGFISRMPLDPLQGAPISPCIGAWAVCQSTANYGYLYGYYVAGQGGWCATSSGAYYVLKVLKMDTVPLGQSHPQSPGWVCPGRSWNSEGAYVMGAFE